MTTQEAWKIYEIEVEQKKESHKRIMKKYFLSFLIIGIIGLILGIVLTIIGFSLPKNITYHLKGTPYEYTSAYDTTTALVLKILGICLLFFTCFFFIPQAVENGILLKKGPKDFLAENKRLYLNSLKAEDADENDIEYFKQKLENIRHVELVNEIRRASAATSAAADTAATAATAAMMYNMIDKK